MTEQDLLIDHFLPHPHFELVRHLIVDAPVNDTYAAAHELDFTDVRGRVATAAGRLRILPECGRDWTLLGDRPGSEFALGVAGKFSKPAIVWRRVEADDFPAFDEPGFGKLVLAVSVVPYGPHRALLTVHTRLRMSDPESWLKVRRYWRIVRPAIGSVHTALIRTVAAKARHRALAAYTRTDQP